MQFRLPNSSLNGLENKYRFNYRLIIEYDGRAFHGWQKQRELVTVQSELERVVRVILRSDALSPLQAAGRTDSGVHASGQVVNFRTSIEIDPLIFKHSVSSMLKGRLSVLDVSLVSEDFHALRSAVGRQYIYRILNRPAPAVLDYGRVWHISSPLDRSLFSEEAKKFIGSHDFTSFRAAGCDSNTTVKEIFDSELIIEGDYLTYRVFGKGYLKQMVRIMVGTLVQIANGKLNNLTVEKILAAKDRTIAGVTAPAHGLYLDFVKYS